MPDTYFENPICPTPGLEGDLAETRGGVTDFSTPGAKGETANSISGLPAAPTTIDVPNGPGKGETFEPPDLSKSMTIVTK